MTKVKEEVTHVAEIIGEWGRWQLICCILFFILNITVAMNNMGFTFHAFQADYWCDDVPIDYPVKSLSV